MASLRSIAPNLLIRDGSLPPADHATRFTGAEHGEVPVSMFLVDAPPGTGPRLHRHPHHEVFVVHSGQGRFQLGDEEVTGQPGDILIAPPLVAHRFTATGDSALRLTAIHASPAMETEWLQ